MLVPVVTGYIGPIHLRDLRLGALVAPGRNDWRPRRMSELELLWFVEEAVSGELLFAQQVEPFEELGTVFPAVGFLTDVEKEARDEVGTFYERRDRAIGTSRSGLPTFHTVQFIHREDWLRARDLIAAETLRRERQ